MWRRWGVHWNLHASGQTNLRNVSHSTTEEIIVEAPCFAMSGKFSRQQTSIDSQNGPWIDDPLGRLRDGGAFNEVKMFLREGDNYIADTA